MILTPDGAEAARFTFPRQRDGERLCLTDYVREDADDWVAMSSEWRAIAVLPGAADAEAWEPEPGVTYVWEKAAVA